MEKERLTEVNYLRAIACLAVIFVHITADLIFLETAGPLTKLGLSFLNRSLKFTTPTFIFISGLILYYNYHDRRIDYRRYWKRRFKVIIIPYVLWTCIYYLYFINRGYYSFSWSFFLEKLLLADMVYHLYFILTILQFYLLFGVFRYLFNKYNANVLLVMFLTVNLLFIRYGYFKYSDRFFMQYLFAFALGCYFGKYYRDIKEKINNYKLPIILGYLGLCLLYTYEFYNLHILQNYIIDGFFVNLTWVTFSMMAIVFYYYVVVNLKGSNLNFIKIILQKISDSSYYIYLGHPLMLFITREILNRFYLPSTTLNFVLTAILVLGTILPFSIIYKAKKDYIFGYLKTLVS